MAKRGTPASPKRQRAERTDAIRNRERVIEVARELFEKHGPEVEIAEVARLAGVGVGTIYRQFPNKPALIQGVGGYLGQRNNRPRRNHRLFGRHQLLFLQRHDHDENLGRPAQ